MENYKKKYFSHFNMWTYIKYLSTIYNNPADIYDANSPLFFCLKWFGIIPLENVCENNIKLYKISNISKFIKYLTAIYTLITGTLFITNILQRKLPLVDQKTLYIAENYRISILLISFIAMLVTDKDDIKCVAKWYSKLTQIDKEYMHEKNVYKNMFIIFLFIVPFFVICQIPVSVCFLYKIYLESQPKHVFISIMYQLGHFRSSFVLHLTANAVYILQQRFKMINTYLVKLSIDNFDKESKTKTIYSYLEFYNELQNMLDEFNSIYGVMRAACIITIFSEISYGAFIILAQLRIEHEIYFYGIYFIYIWWVFSNMALVTYPIYVSRKCLEEVSFLL